MEAKIDVNIKNILSKTKEFGNKFEALCKEYGVAPNIATNEETGEVFLIVNVKDLIDENDIDMKIEK